MAGEVTYLVAVKVIFLKVKGNGLCFQNWTIISIKLGFIISDMSPKILIIVRLFYSSHKREL